MKSLKFTYLDDRDFPELDKPILSFYKQLKQSDKLYSTDKSYYYIVDKIDHSVDRLNVYESPIHKMNYSRTPIMYMKCLWGGAGNKVPKTK